MKITLPIYWTNEFKTRKDTTHLVSMNFYRNAHYHTQNKLKKYFHELVEEQVGALDKFKGFDGKYKLLITVYYKNPACDGSNIASLIEKFALDALQEEGAIVNDNFKYHSGTTWEDGGRDKENPRCTVEIIEHTTKNKGT